MAVQAEDAFGHLDARSQLIRIEGLGHEIVRSGVHRFQVVGLAFERGEQDQVGVIIVWLLADLRQRASPSISGIIQSEIITGK
jgi:hypothetical protein